MHPKEEGFTWFSGDGTRASRIDYVFTRDCPATDARLTPVFFSDHLMLSCTLSLPSGVTSGSALWKLNCFLLEDRELVRQYREQYKEWQTLQDFYDIREREPVSPVRGLALGEPSTVWRDVNRPVLPNRLWDLSWMVAHEILPVRSVMHSRGMAAHATCPRPGCRTPESVRHLLWECGAAEDQWAMAGSLQFPYLPVREFLTAQLVLYGVSPTVIPPKDFAEQWLTLAAIKDVPWTSRNLLVRKHMQIPPVAVIRMAAATVLGRHFVSPERLLQL
ncbi:hypothetical protein D4764_13G0001640 [Takifugu flavidus]|uniref:Uncharacterized protein n=1 Tax=Takifugu flavidus TaxID=433684 RepID=A0A5C6P738_9TELE|nr:hypothetical protein D4764_13G0001640 [Takifugu flavidus]